MLIGIEGGLGDGKTAKMTEYLINDAKKGYDLFSNYKLFGVPFYELDVAEMLENEQKEIQLKNATIGVDEITVFADCRLSTSVLNRLFSYFVLQSRKRSVDMYYTTQDFDLVDWRIVNHTHIKIIAESLYTKEGDVIPDIKHYTIIDARNKNRIRIDRFYQNISHTYDHYDTDEVIKPPLFNIRLKNDRVKA